jgi:hypothetical protein
VIGSTAKSVTIGTYRLVWHDAVHSCRDEPPLGTPLPLEERTSNELTLSALAP